MRSLIDMFRKLFASEEGQGLAEYALIIVFIAVVCIAALTLLGVNVVAVLQQIAGAL